MNNLEIYKKTRGFSLRRIFWEFLSVILLFVLGAAGFAEGALTGVLRNFINSGINDVPTEASVSFLDSKSDKFRKLHQQA